MSSGLSICRKGRRRANCPNCGKQIEYGSQDCPYCQYIIFQPRPRIEDPVERKWLIWSILGGMMIHLAIFARYSRESRSSGVDVLVAALEWMFYIVFVGLSLNGVAWQR